MKLKTAEILDILIALIVLIFFVGCTGYQKVTTTEEPVSVIQTKKDLFAKAILNKEGSLLQDIAGEMLEGGEIIKTTVKGERFGNVEIAKEVWIIKDAKGNLHVITWKNGVLDTIDEYKEKASKIKQKPFGKKK